MALPLPRVVADVGPGGPLVTAMRGGNALNDEILKTKMQQLQNQYYGPNIQSEIANRNALTQGQNITNQYLPDKLKLANAFQQLQNQYYGPNIQSEILNRNALTNRYNTITPLEAAQLKLTNQFYPDVTRSNIAAQQAMANYRNMGGSGMGTGGKEELMFQNLVHKDNPHLSPDQVYEASNVLRQGGSQLSDGTPLRPLSPASQASYDRIVRGTTTAPILTGNIRANQAEAELKVLNNYAQKGLEPYGDTILNYSPQQIMDSFKTDDSSQKRLGKFIAAQALQYEAAQNRIRLANGQPGVTSSEELMKLSGQRLNSRYPTLSYNARKEASRYLDEALEEGLKARKSVGIGASETRKMSNSNKKATLRYNPQTGDFEEIK